MRSSLLRDSSDGKYKINSSFIDVSILSKSMSEHCGYSDFIGSLPIQKSIVTVIDPIGRDDSDYCRDFVLILSMGGVKLIK
jgi:hypothetical protein